MNTFSALSVVTPAGDRIRAGRKTLEIRKWQPDSLPLRNLLIVQNSIRLSSEGQSEDPGGKIVAIVDVESVDEWKEADLEASCANYWEPGWLAWKLVNVRPFECDEPVVAKLRIYEVQIP